MVASRRLDSGAYWLDFQELYARLWDLAEDLGDGTRLYVSEGDASLKWIIAELSGTPAEAGRKLRDNNALRKQTHVLLAEGGWAERISERKFRLLLQPGPSTDEGKVVDASAPDGEPLLIDDSEDEGVAVDEVPADRVTGASGGIDLGEAEWSGWTTLTAAVKCATRSPGVYLARAGLVIVYVGMAGERRGQGVRGRLTVYARGRGAVSGLGEAVLDRALGDPDWVAQRLRQLRESGPTRAKGWAAAAFNREPLEVAWTATADAKSALDLERQVLIELADADLWNRGRPR